MELCSKVLTAAKGDRGEVAAAAWFGYTLDGIRKSEGEEYDAENTSLSREVSILQFLKALCPNETMEQIESQLDGWQVNVTHFCRLPYSPNRHVLPVCWNRRVGIYPPEGEDGIDMLIVICKKQGKICHNEGAGQELQE